MQNKKKADRKLVDGSKLHGVLRQEPEFYEGERLVRLLKVIQREIESTRKLDGDSLPYKIWLKKQFAIGVNEVSRVLERMAPSARTGTSPQQSRLFPSNRMATSVKLQAILVAADCNPRWLTKHLPSLALSRDVPIVFVKDKNGGSLRLGELVKLKTAIAIGIKAKGNAINQIVDKFIHSTDMTSEADCPILTKKSDVH